MISLGLDSGSSMTKAVLLEDTKIIDTKMIPTSISPRKSLEDLYREIQKQHKEIDVIVTTGYGRSLLDQADFKITEITCHAAGAFFYDKKVLFPAAHMPDQSCNRHVLSDNFL